MYRGELVLFSVISKIQASYMKVLRPVKDCSMRKHLRNKDIEKDFTVFSVINRTKEIDKFGSLMWYEW